MSSKSTQQAGFTLVEISLAMAIFTFMLLVVSMAYINIARLYNASTAARLVQQNNRFAVEQMSRVARSSSKAELVTNVGEAKKGICLSSTTGSQLFYLRSLGADTKKNELVQSSSCVAPVNGAPKVLSSPGAYAVDMALDTSGSRTATMTLWMSSKTDLVNTVDGTGLQCRSGTGSEFCAINKLTTTVELRGY